MAITLDATSVSANVSDVSVTWSHTVASGATLLVVAVQLADSTLSDRTVSGVTWGGVALSLAKAYNPAARNYSAEIWYKTSPIAATANIEVTCGGKCTDIQCSAISLFGTAITNPVHQTNEVLMSGSASYVSFDGSIPLSLNNCFLIETSIGTEASVTDFLELTDVSLNLTDLGAYCGHSVYKLDSGTSTMYNLGYLDTTDIIDTIGAIAAFKPATGGTASSNVQQYMSHYRRLRN